MSDSIIWSKEARERLDRMPPFVRTLVEDSVHTYAAEKGHRVITTAVMEEAQQKGKMSWTPEAEQRLQNIPLPIRAMAKAELERMAAQKGLAAVTEALMDEAKERFLGMRGP